MAKMRNTSPTGGLISTRVPVTNILSVGRQPHNKRQPHEVENIDNAFVSLERNVEKRPGFDVVLPHDHPSLTDGVWNWTNDNTHIDLFALDAVKDHDLWYYWYHINEDSRFLVVVDFDADGKDVPLFYNYHLKPDGTWEDVTGAWQWDPTDPEIASPTPNDPNHSPIVEAYRIANNITYVAAKDLGTLSRTTRRYITHNTVNKTAKESLKAVTLGTSVVILNTNVSAGFSSDYYADDVGLNGKLFSLDGVTTGITNVLLSGTVDDRGRRITYFSASRVLEVFNQGEDGKSDTGDDISIGYKIDPPVTGMVSATSSTGAFTVTLEALDNLYSNKLRSGSTVSTCILSLTDTDVENSYIGHTIQVTAPNSTTPAVTGETRTAEIISYNSVTKHAVCWDKAVVHSGTLAVDHSINDTVFNIGTTSTPLVGHFLEINNEYRRIIAYASPNATISHAFSADNEDFMVALTVFRVTPYVVSKTDATTLSTNSSIALGPYLDATAHTYKGKFITIEGETRQIILHPGGVGNIANIVPVLSFTPDPRSQYTINDGIGWGGRVVTVQSTDNSNTFITLPDTAPSTDDVFNGYTLQVGSSTNTKVITDYDGATRKVIFTTTDPDISPLAAVGALVQILPPVNSAYTILPQNAEDAFYVGYKILLETTVPQTRLITNYVSATNIVTLDTALTADVTANETTYRITSGNSVYIPAGDYSYYKTELMHLGQLVSDISSIKLPPEDYDWYANNANLNDPNNADINARVMLAALYDEDHPHSECVDGRGKIYLTTNSYLNLTAGYYRVIDFVESREHVVATGVCVGEPVVGTGRPYLQKIRTPDHWSYIDPARMPQKLSFTLDSNLDYVWEAEPMKWTPRDTGNNDTNPGPSIFRNLKGTELKHSKITSLAVFKNRLWFAADDVVFSSRVGDYENLFVEDPTQIVDTDPIDIRASSNTFAQITTMTPFEDYMFVNTKADTQFQLMSSNVNNGQDLSITPFNVVLSPSTYYAAAAIVDPQLLGNQLYFFDRRRMYLFTGKNQLGYTSAVEISSTIQDYLPENYGHACTSAAHNTVFLTDGDNPNNIYCYTIRFSGDRVIQSSFYRHILSPSSNIVALQAYENTLFAVVFDGDPELDTSRIYLMKLDLRNTDVDIPRLDKKYETVLNVTGHPSEVNCFYDEFLNETTIKVPWTGIFTDHISNGFAPGLFVVLADNWLVSTSSPITASIAGTLMTVTDTEDLNIINVGSVITGGSLPFDGVVVTGFITGTGGVGEYRISGPNITQSSTTLQCTVTDDISGTIFSDLKASPGNAANPTTLTILGRYDMHGKSVYIGSAYTTEVELSEVFVRDQSGAVYTGTLNLRTCRITHHKTGNYDVVVSHRGRTPNTSSFTAARVDFTEGEDLLSLQNLEDSGTFQSAVFGYSDTTNVKLVSSYITPMNIVDLEFMGKFKKRHTIL